MAMMLTTALGVGLSVPAFAQSQETQQTTTTTTTTVDKDPNADMSDTGAMGPNNQDGDPICGVWVNGVWQGNGRCPGYAVGPHRARVAGTITIVRGHLVTVQMADKTIVINDTTGAQPRDERSRRGRPARS